MITVRQAWLYKHIQLEQQEIPQLRAVLLPYPISVSISLRSLERGYLPEVFILSEYTLEGMPKKAQEVVCILLKIQ